jgi:phosphoglucomutase/phosphomannomutase
VDLAAVRTAFEALPVRPETRAAALVNLERWLTDPEFADYVPQLRSLVARGKWDLLLDSFYQVIPFGTGGRRGSVGVGPNRFNPWTLSASVQGHVTWLRETRPDAAEPHVVLAYDVRRFIDANGVYDPSLPNPCMGLSSRDFAEIAAGVYAANGVRTTLLAPGSGTWVSTPELSFAIRHLRADGGLNISASHNPPDDNGGKFYNALGGQEVPPNDAVMAGHVARVTRVRAMPYADARTQGWARDLPADVHPAYVRANLATSLRPDARSAHVVYTNLHGTGDTTVRDVLVAAGFRTELEPTCAPHDPTFANVPFRSPNPEVRGSMDRAVVLATELGADLVLATDPDADRIGLQARGRDGVFRFFTGNEIATLVAEYRLANGRFEHPIVMKTEVTSDQVARVARHHGAQVVGDLMVGFKYIGEGLRLLEANGRFRDASGTLADFVIGVEESHGVLVTPAMRDKDAAGAALALAEYASVLKAEGRTLVDALESVWSRDGYVHNELVSTVMRGAAGKARIERIQAELRATPPVSIGGLAVTAVLDRADPEGPLGPILSDTDAASRDVLVFTMGDTARILLRPSGTEPKNKIYVEYKGRPGSDPATEIPRCAEAARALARAFAQDMLARVDVHVPAWALRVSDLCAIESKVHLAETLLPALLERLARGVDPRDPELQAWLDAELRAYGKDPRKLVAEAVRAWADGAGDGAAGVVLAFA